MFQIPSRRRLEHFAGTMGKLGLAFVGVLLGCTFLSWVVMLGGAAGMQAKCGGCRFLKPTRQSLLPHSPAISPAPPAPCRADGGSTALSPQASHTRRTMIKLQMIVITWPAMQARAEVRSAPSKVETTTLARSAASIRHTDTMACGSGGLWRVGGS